MFGQLARTVFRVNRPLFGRCSSYLGTGRVNYSVASSSEKAEPGEEELDKPIKFSTSGAAKYTAKESLSGDAFPDSPSWQPEVVILSVGAFLIYFLALREENDIDEEMNKPLWDRIPNLERQQLEIVLEYNRNNGLDTAAIEKRLKELYIQEADLKKTK